MYTLVPERRGLESFLQQIWCDYFADIQPLNTVRIAYQYPWKTRLGLIRMTLDESISFIGINSLLQIAQVPECILITTIAHELVHYTHGFGSPRPRLYEDPHANGVVDNELYERGLSEQLDLCNTWVDTHWYHLYEQLRAAPIWSQVCRSTSAKK